MSIALDIVSRESLSIHDNEFSYIKSFKILCRDTVLVEMYVVRFASGSLWRSEGHQVTHNPSFFK